MPSVPVSAAASVSPSRRRRGVEPAGYYFDTDLDLPGCRDFEDRLCAQDAFKFCMIAMLLAMYAGWTSYAVLL